MTSQVAAAAQPFVLHPFDTDSAPPVSLSGSLLRQDRSLRVEYRLVGTENLLMPSLSAPPSRGHELWKQTCFEIFFPAQDAAYHEVNLSPSGDWNLYLFDGYRQGMREEKADCLRCEILSEADTLIVRMEIDLSQLGLGNKALKTGPCAVLISKKGIPSYWAPSHPGSRPDFHDKRAWPFRV